MDFSTLELHPDLKRALTEAGYLTATPVQEQVIANAFSGCDIYVQSQTGTGKTAAYLIVIIQRLLNEPLLAGRKALIMVPTRELAVQVEDEMRVLGKYLNFKTGAFYGGVGYGNQTALLRDDAQILVGTPGRVLDLNASGTMNLMNIGFLVLDEADRMFDMGFYPDLRKLIKVLPPADKRQTMLFSATLNNYVKNLAWEYTKKPVEIEIEPESVTVDEIDQVLYHVSSGDKFRLLLGIFQNEKPESALIFCNTKRYTEKITHRLRANGIKVDYISGDLAQSRRLAVIDDFKGGKVSFLVATDVAARGLDVDSLALVVNYDIPRETENYVHRIGRTARAGKSGRAITFASEQDIYELAGIERYIGKKIPSKVASEEMFAEDIAPEAARPKDRGQRAPHEPRPQFKGRLHEGRNRKREDMPREDRFKEERSFENKKPFDKNKKKGQHKNKFAAKENAGFKEEGEISPEVAGMRFEDRIKFYKSKYSGSGSKDGIAKTRQDQEKKQKPVTRVAFPALTMASTFTFVMSPCTSSKFTI
ncbi:ATP-dependent RNA helicase RhlB [Spirochaetia bacterium]|nr:ATP-dependent RNA helicase RhlB [Spirochaetia bacterium]